MSEKLINVAVVDDEESIRRALARLLRAAGFNPVSYSSAEEFLDSPARAQTDCLVLDIQLGGMSGFDLQKRLAANGAVPPIIFITAHEGPTTLEQTRNAGCVAFFRKPVPGSVLLEAVRRAVSPWDNTTD